MERVKNKSCNGYIKAWVPVIAWMVLIFFLSSLSVTPSPKIYWQDFIIKKTAHIFEYLILTTLLYRGFRLSGHDKSHSATYSVSLAVAYAITDEIHQSFTPGRHPKIYDVIFDTIGALLAILLLWKLLPQAPQKLKSWARKSDLL